MIKGTTKFLLALTVVTAFATGGAFATTLISLAPRETGYQLMAGDGSIDHAIPGGGNNIDAARTWGNSGTDFSTGANWVGGSAPGVGDVAVFGAAAVTQPNLASSASISGFYFNTTGSSGYDITASAGASFTLTGRSTTGSGGTADSSAAAIRSDITSGTNTIDAPLILAPSSGPSTFFLAAGGTLVINGIISDAGAGKALSIKNGTLQLNAPNTFSGGASIDASSTTLVIGDNSALGTGTFSINSNTTTLQASGGARTLANNVVFGGNTTLSGSNAFTFNGTITSSGSSTRTLTVSNTGGATFGGTVNLEESGAPAGRVFTINGTSAVVMNGVVQDGSAQPALLKYTGSSTLTLNNTNTYSGGTQETIAGSTIIATHDHAFGTGGVSLTTASVTLTLQNGATNDYINDAATLSFVTGDTVNLNYNGTDTVAGLIVNNVSQAAGVYGAGSFAQFAGTGTITVVPEPTTVAMTLLGAGLLVGAQRYRRRTR